MVNTENLNKIYQICMFCQFNKYI